MTEPQAQPLVMTRQSDRLSRRTLVVVALLALCGLAVRIWILASQFGRADSDESVVGLMARGMLHGDLVVYFWGQAYGGSLEAVVAAVLFKLFGVEVFALKVAPILLNLAGTLVLWRFARRSFDARSAAIGAAMFWSSPFAYVWLSTKERGFYEAGLFSGAVVMLCVVKMLERPQLRVAAIGGFASGVALWTTPQSMYLLIPACLVYIACAPFAQRVPDLHLRTIAVSWFKGFSQFAKAWPAVPAFLLGLLPAIVSNVRSDWLSLRLPDQGTHVTTYWQRLRGFFTEGFPLVTGAKIPYIGDWVLPILGPLMVVGGVAVIIAAVASILRKKFRTTPGHYMLVLLVLMYPFIFAVSPFSWFVGDGRYLSFLWVGIALLTAFVTARFREVVAVGLAALCVFTMATLLDWPGQRYSHDLLTEDLDPLVKTLDDSGVKHAYADYWIAYRVTLETNERITVSPAWTHRKITLKERVESSTENTVYVTFKNSKEERDFYAQTVARNLNPVREEVGAFAVYSFDKDLPADLVYHLAGF